MEKLKIDDFIKYKFISDLKISPESRYAAFLIHQCDSEKDSYISQLYCMDMGSEEIRILCSCISFEWENDENIILTSDKLKYITLNIDTGKLTEKLSFERETSIAAVLGGGCYAVLSEYDCGSADLKSNENCEYITELPLWFNGRGFVSRKRNRLYIYDSIKGTLSAVSSDKFTVKDVKPCQDKHRIVYCGHEYDGIEGVTDEIHVYDMCTAEDKVLIKSGKFSVKAIDVWGSSLFLAASDMKNYGLHENPHLYAIDTNSGGIHEICDLDASLGSTVGSDCRYGTGIVFKAYNGCIHMIATVRNEAVLCKVRADGEISVECRIGGSVDLFDIAGGVILFVGMKNTKLQELYILNEECEKERQITEFNEFVINTRRTSVPMKISFVNSEGTEIDGWIMLPDDFDEDKKYPAVLNIHGGPKSVYGEIFYHEMQYWAGCGYVVIFCNPTGSDGRGNSFADLRERCGTIDYADIIEFVRHASDACRQIDHDRIGVTGGSYGGYMTNWIIGHTEMFKAAVSQRGISNWLSDFNMSDISYYYTPNDMKSTPWNGAEILWDNSPVKYADKVKTPTLIIHSEFDYHCTLADAVQMFAALKLNGTETQLCIFKGENHELSRSGRPSSRVERLRKIVEWFDKYLK